MVIDALKTTEDAEILTEIRRHSSSHQHRKSRNQSVSKSSIIDCQILIFSIQFTEYAQTSRGNDIRRAPLVEFSVN